MKQTVTLTPEQAREVLNVLAELGDYPSIHLRESYTALATIEAEGVRLPFDERLEAARAGALNEETLPDLVQDPSVAVRRSLARRDDLPAEVQVVLAEDPQVLHILADRADLTPEAARMVFEANKCNYALAENRACPPEILEGLYERNPSVAPTLANNPATPPDLLHRMALMESDDWVLRRIAEHPNVTLSTLGHLADSSEPGVARTARQVLSQRLERAVEWER